MRAASRAHAAQRSSARRVRVCDDVEVDVEVRSEMEIEMEMGTGMWLAADADAPKGLCAR